MSEIENWVRPIAINYCTTCSEAFKTLEDEKSDTCTPCLLADVPEDEYKPKTELRK